MGRGARVIWLSVGLAFAAFPAVSHGARCAEPDAAWQTATPAQQGLDAAQLARALHSYQDRRAWAVRIFRNGCLVTRDTNTGNEDTLFEGWEMTSSVLALVAARQMTLGLLSPDDVVGAFVPEADAEHGAIRVRDLLQRSSGLINQPDNIYLRDRLRLALTSGFSEQPGRAFGDSPLARALLVTVLERAARQDVAQYASGQLFYPLGIKPWRWTRDRAGQPVGSFGLQLTVEDLARLGELLMREGRWRDHQLIDPDYIRAALTPSPRNPCMGWLIWLNAAHGCSGTPQRLLPGLPRDLWSWVGYQDQRVTGIPSLGLLVVRYGMTAGDPREGADGLTWERDLLRQLLAAVRDTPVPDEGDRNSLPPAVGSGYRDDLASGIAALPSLPPAGPWRARVPRLSASRERTGRERLLGLRVRCPENAARTCAGTARLVGVFARSRRWSAKPGSSANVLFRLASRLRRARDIEAEVRAEDGAKGVTATLTLHARR